MDRKYSDYTERKERKPEEKIQKSVESKPVQNTEKKEESAPVVKPEEPGEYEIEEGEDVSANMAQLMGFSSFGSTKVRLFYRCEE